MLTAKRHIESRRARGWVIRVLHQAYPAGVELTDLVTGLQPVFQISESGLKPHLTYLEEKGYLTIEAKAVLGDEVTLVRLTTKGTDLVEGSIVPDPGVSLAGAA